jgi:hypothetical protein
VTCCSCARDGLLEARDADGVFFSPEHGLRASWRQGPPTVVETLADLVHRHAGGVLADDLALLAATVSPLPCVGTFAGGGAV